LSDSQTFNQIILFNMIFLGILFLYNQSNATVQFALQATIDDIFRPLPIYQSPTCTIQWWDFFVPTSCGATTLASTVFWGIALIGAFLFKLGATGILIVQLFQLTNVTTGVPFVGYIIIAFQVMLVIYGATLIRG